MNILCKLFGHKYHQCISAFITDETPKNTGQYIVSEKGEKQYIMQDSHLVIPTEVKNICNRCGFVEGEKDAASKVKCENSTNTGGA